MQMEVPEHTLTHSQHRHAHRVGEPHTHPCGCWHSWTHAAPQSPGQTHITLAPATWRTGRRGGLWVLGAWKLMCQEKSFLARWRGEAPVMGQEFGVPDERHVSLRRSRAEMAPSPGPAEQGTGMHPLTWGTIRANFWNLLQCPGPSLPKASPRPQPKASLGSSLLRPQALSPSCSSSFPLTPGLLASG